MKEKNYQTVDEAKEFIDFIEGEIWKVIPNYSSYLISNYGRIFGFARKAVKNIKKNKGHRYLTTRLYDDNGVFSNSMYIHRLVAEAFCENDDPQNKTVVHHRNINSLDNRADNLIWMTEEEHNKLHSERRAKRNEA